MTNSNTEVNGEKLARSLLFTVFVLTVLGLVVIFTSSSINANENYGDMFFFFKKQLFSCLLGGLTMIPLFFIPIRVLEKLNLIIFLAACLILYLTLIPGLQHTVNGASRWIKIGSFSLQPAELCKITLILFLAKNLSRKSAGSLNKPISLLSNIIPFSLFAFALMLQPDFGSTLLLASLTFILLFSAGLPIRFVISSIIIGMGAITAAIWHAPYRLARLTSFLDPWQSVKTGGFQIIQSYLGFFNGGLLGLGLGESRQKLYFLPEAHTDFILSVIGEELGLFGVVLTISLFAYLTWIGFKITSLQKDNFRRYFAFGLSCLIAIQASINMGVSMGLLPTKGMPLPFVSYGSTALLVFLWGTGILAKIAIETEKSNEAGSHQTT